MAGADLHEVRRHLRLLAQVDRDDVVRQAGLLQHHARLVAVVGDPGVAIDHVILPKKFCMSFRPRFGGDGGCIGADEFLERMLFLKSILAVIVQRFK